jgi:hypothetical protein
VRAASALAQTLASSRTSKSHASTATGTPVSECPIHGKAGSCMTIAQVIGDYDNSTSMGSKFRQRRSGPLRDMIARIHREKRSVSILDVGGMENYWTIFPEDFLRQKRVRIVLLNLEKDIFSVRQEDIFSTSVGDGCALSYDDDSFEICHSNSVIEHVGSWRRKSAFAQETSRVAPCYFHQTPNF